jgi:hypothetical protein
MPGVVTGIAAWMLDSVACTGMAICAPRVAVSALVDLHATEAASRPVTRSGGVGVECDSVFARLFECHAADGKGLR